MVYAMFIFINKYHLLGLFAVSFLLASCNPQTESSKTEENTEYLSFKPDINNEEDFWKKVAWSHPDVKEILKDPEFLSWLLDQNTEIKQKINTKSHRDAIELIDQYKAEGYYNKALKLTYSRSNMPKVLELLRESVLYGNMKSSFYLGELYRKGDLIEKNRRKAFYYLTKARKSGNTQANISLKEMGFMRYD